MIVINLQLGFLKLLHGSLMREEKDKYGIVARDIPPYEVLYTKYLSYDDILKLKQVEKVLDMYYNSNMFVLSVRYLSGSFDDSFAMYELITLLPLGNHAILDSTLISIS